MDVLNNTKEPADRERDDEQDNDWVKSPSSGILYTSQLMPSHGY